MKVGRTLSVFWSDKEYKFIKGELDDSNAKWTAINKMMRALHGLLEIENSKMITEQSLELARKVYEKFSELYSKR